MLSLTEPVTTVLENVHGKSAFSLIGSRPCPDFKARGLLDNQQADAVGFSETADTDCAGP